MIKLSKLFIHDTTSSRSEVEIFVGSSEQQPGKKLLLLCEFPKSRQDQTYLLDAIIKQCVESFEATIEHRTEVALEKILEDLNYLLPEITPKKNKVWLQNLNIAVCLLHRNEAHFAAIGVMSAWLLHQGVLTQLTSGSKMINPLKLFTDVTSGDLNKGDVLLLTTPALTDYISEVKIKQIVGHGSPAEMVEKFDVLLQAVPTFVSFAAIIVKAMESAQETDLPEREKTRTTQHESLSTAEPKLEADYPAPQVRRTPRRQPFRAPSGQRIISFLSFIARSTRDYIGIIRTVLVTMFRYVLAAVMFIVSARYRQPREKAAWDSIEVAVSTVQKNWRRQSALSRWLVSGTGLIILVVLNVIIISGLGAQINKQRSTYNETLVTIADLQARVDSSRQYKDDKQAETILVSMVDMLSQLRPSNPAQQQELDQIQEKVARQLNEVRHINYVASPLMYQDLSTINNIQYVSVSGATTYVTAADGLYKVTDGIEKIATSTLTNGRLLQTGNNLFVLNDKTLLKLNGSSLDTASLTLNSGLQNIDKALIYADNLYILDRASSSIYKQTGNGSAFGSGNVWLQEAGLLSSTQDFTIDGNIWLINDQGEIIKLYKGQRENYDYQKPSPLFGTGSSILTTSKSSYLYILDPANKRVAIIDKNGAIKDQYTSPKFDNLKSFAIDADEKIIYLLNGNTIYQLAINK
jgi:hypothetical protein